MTPKQFIKAALRCPDKNACFLWPFGTTAKGYGNYQYTNKSGKRKQTTPHRTGKKGKGKHARHGPCNNRLCCNPHHLKWGTAKQNAADKVRDGTSRRILSPKLIKKIKKDNRTHRAIAADYGIGKTTVTRAKGGKYDHY